MIGLDSAFIIDFLHDDEAAMRKGAELEGQQLVTTHVVMFEVFVGIHLKYKGSEKRMKAAKEFFERIDILEQDDTSAHKSAEISAASYAKGTPVGSSDALIAGVLLSHGCNKIVTRDTGFRNMGSLSIETY